ncbi:hypothetical protein Tco_0172849 [Tanacetum coccineum]
MEGIFRETLSEGNEGALHLGPERPRVYSDLSPEDKDRYNADIRATNILLQGLPKDIYSSVLHYSDAKDIWDYLKMLLDGSAGFGEARTEPGNANQVSKPRSGATNLQQYMPHSKELTTAQVIQNPFTSKTNFYFNASSGAMGALDEEQLLFLTGGHDNAINEDVDEQPVQDLALNVDNVFQDDDCDAFDSDVDEAPTAQTMF